MNLVASTITAAVGRRVPPSLRAKLRTRTGTQFLRFVPVSVAAVVASQLVLVILIEAAHVAAGLAGIVASMVGAGVSYVLSRWAWHRKGRPSMLRETLPFWAVSVAAWLVLGTVTHYVHQWAVSQHLHSLDRIALVNGAYFVANCLTFVGRFAIFHYVLFADRGSRLASVDPAEAADSVAVALAREDEAGGGAAGDDAGAGAGARPAADRR